MSKLELRLNDIWNIKLDEYPWGRYWNDLKKWSFPKRILSGNVVYLASAKIRSYLNAPLIPPFGILKEEATKIIVSHYHKGTLWLLDLVKIIPCFLEESYFIGGSY